MLGRFVCGPKQLTQSSKPNKTLKQSNLPTDQVVQSTILGYLKVLIRIWGEGG